MGATSKVSPMLTREQIKLIRGRVAQIEQVLAGLSPDMIGAILADITATWLAGWQGEGVEQAREELLKLHMDHIRELIPVNEQIAAERQMGNQEKLQ